MPPADEALYTLMLPTGREGPYSLADLRALVAAGKARRSDEVQDQASRAMTTVGALLPDAVDAGTDPRVRRRTSDRLAAQAAAPHPRVRTPQPGSLRTEAPVAEPAVAHAAAPPPAVRRRGPKPLLLLAVLVPVAAAAWWFVAPGLGMRQAPVPPPLDPAGTWTVAEVPGHGGPWSISVRGDQLSISGPGATPVTVATRREADGRWSATYDLAHPHPVLGRRIRLVMQADAAWVMTDTGGLPATHAAP